MLKGVCIGAGYFSRFHFEAWNRMPEVQIMAICDQDLAKARSMASEFSVAKVYDDIDEMLDKEKPDFVDIITPPDTHLDICRKVFKRRINTIIQKPLAPTLETAKQILKQAEDTGIRLMLHENFRFQPWYREIKKILDAQIIGDTIFSAYFRMRMGDGWGEDAYLNRQPYFREMPRLLLYETGIHFIDTFRYLFGEVDSLCAKLRKLNPVIAGEDAGIVQFDFVDGTQAIWDASRYNESNSDSPRYTFGEMLIEGNEGSIRLYNDGRLTLQLLGQQEMEHDYPHENINFAGDCVFALQQHFIKSVLYNTPFETSPSDYLYNMLILDTAYRSAATGKPLLIAEQDGFYQI